MLLPLLIMNLLQTHRADVHASNLRDREEQDCALPDVAHLNKIDDVIRQHRGVMGIFSQLEKLRWFSAKSRHHKSKTLMHACGLCSIFSGNF